MHWRLLRDLRSYCAFAAYSECHNQNEIGIRIFKSTKKREKILPCLDVRHVCLHYTHTHRQIDRNRTAKLKILRMCAALVYSTKDIDMVLFDRPPSPFRIYWNDPAAGQPAEVKEGAGGMGFSTPCQHYVNLQIFFFFLLFLRFHFVSGGLFQPVHDRK